MVAGRVGLCQVGSGSSRNWLVVVVFVVDGAVVEFGDSGERAHVTTALAAVRLCVLDEFCVLLGPGDGGFGELQEFESVLLQRIENLWRERICATCARQKSFPAHLSHRLAPHGNG